MLYAQRDRLAGQPVGYDVYDGLTRLGVVAKRRVNRTPGRTSWRWLFSCRNCGTQLSGAYRTRREAGEALRSHLCGTPGVRWVHMEARR